MSKGKLDNIADGIQYQLNLLRKKIDEYEAWARGYEIKCESEYVRGVEDGKASAAFADTEQAEKLAYQRGLKDAWEALGLWCDLSNKQRMEIFGLYRTSEMVKRYAAEEAKQRILEHISVGDVVYNTNNRRNAVVLKVYSDDSATVVEQTIDGTMVHTPPLRALRKTGKHIDLDKWLSE